jgi:Na+-translocating ferredoxin:NAD+ oxidoreductase RnfC subunit
MLKKGMNVEFTSKEFGSLVQPFLDEDDPRIANSAELMKLFIQLQNEYREEQRQRRIEAERALHHARFEEERKREEDKRAKSEMKLKHKEEDEKSLMVKLKRVAQSFVFDRYNTTSTANMLFDFRSVFLFREWMNR